MTPNLTTVKTPFFSSLWQRSKNLPLHQLLEPGQCFQGNPESELLNLQAHQLTLAITKKTIDENHFRATQKTMNREPPSFKLGDRIYFKNKQPGNGISSGDPDTGLFILSMADTTCT